MKKIIIGLLLSMLILSAVATGCAKKETPENSAGQTVNLPAPKVVKFGVQPSLQPPHIANMKGFLRKLKQNITQSLSLSLLHPAALRTMPWQRMKSAGPNTGWRLRLLEWKKQAGCWWQ